MMVLGMGIGMRMGDAPKTFQSAEGNGQKLPALCCKIWRWSRKTFCNYSLAVVVITALAEHKIPFEVPLQALPAISVM